ncbi:hypothetical protein, partial [Paenibacillus polymyxa]|uniref:hypothetical protein n=2 Tax=Paenibacillus TaxID=44249 RepID=UPI001EE43B7E
LYHKVSNYFAGNVDKLLAGIVKQRQPITMIGCLLVFYELSFSVSIMTYCDTVHRAVCNGKFNGHLHGGPS